MKLRTKIKLEQIVRYRAAGVKDIRIAQLVGLTTSGLARILTTPDYIQLQEEYLCGQLSDMDVQMAGRVAELNKQMQTGVPAAVRTMLELCTQRKDLKTALKAATEILQRDPQKIFAVRGAGDSQSDPAADRLSDAVLRETVGEADKVVDGLSAALTQQKTGSA